MGRILIAALGFRREQLTLGALDALRAGKRNILRTQLSDCAAYLREQQIPFESLDALYETAEDFSAFNESVAAYVLGCAEEQDVVYGVADLRDSSVECLLQRAPQTPTLLAGAALEGGLLAYAGTSYRTLAASDWEAFQADSRVPTLIYELDSRVKAGELKLKLMERYPEELQIRMLTPEGHMARLPLSHLDRLEAYDHRTSALIPAVPELTALEQFGFDQLNAILRRLRAPGGCPWDIQQTHESIRSNMLEEAYEVVDAIDRDSIEDMVEELGDVLMQVAFHAEIGRNHGEFSIDDVTTAVCRKLISRHPHIFAQAQAENAEDVLKLWESIKKKEKQVATQAENMRAVTRGLPALMRAEKIQKKAADVQFDWENALDALAKVREEADELQQALTQRGNVNEEVGDLLFAVVNVARLAKIKPEIALTQATEKFTDRFERMERLILEEKGALAGMTLEEMDVYWNRVKQNTRTGGNDCE